MGNDTPIQSVQTAFQIVETIIHEKQWTVTEIATELEMPLSTTHNYLRSLVEAGYLRKHDNKYQISTRFLEIANRDRFDTELFTTAKPVLKEFAEETGEFSMLMIEEDGLGVVYGIEKGSKVEHIKIRETHPGIRTHLHTTATGKAILAESSDKKIGRIIDSLGLTKKTDNTITEREELFDDIESIRDNGYAIDREERFDGMCGVGVAIFSELDQLQGAISVYGPTHQINEELVEGDLPKRVLEAANIIQVSLNYA